MAAKFPFYHSEKTTFRHREVVTTTLDLGVKIEKKYLTNIRSIRGYEQVYDNRHYHVSVVIYPKGERIVCFERMFEGVKKQYGDLLLPVFLLVEKGVFGNWFALFFKTDFKLREGLYWVDGSHSG